MATELLYRADAYLNEAEARVLGLTPEGGLMVDRSVFYAAGGGQPGDSGWISWMGPDGQARTVMIATAVKAEADRVALVAAEAVALPGPGAAVRQRLDWPRRHKHMRVHTALHLLSVVIPLPVTGGQIGAGTGRLDFDMPEPPGDLAVLEARLNALVDADWPVTEHWITEDELAVRPDLVRTLSVRPRVGAGRVRLVRIGDGAQQIDLQPCGGTHVARTGEIGSIRLGKLEKKGRRNRRVTLHLD
jgi:misacylated tRNA(Ala) deacylase